MPLAEERERRRDGEQRFARILDRKRRQQQSKRSRWSGETGVKEARWRYIMGRTGDMHPYQWLLPRKKWLDDGGE